LERYKYDFIKIHKKEVEKEEIKKNSLRKLLVKIIFISFSI
jgi:hypothetical protein